MKAILCLFTVFLGMAAGCVRLSDSVSKAARGAELVEALSRAGDRNTAYCELLQLHLHRRGVRLDADTCAPVTAVLEAPQPQGPPITMVFSDPGYEVERGPARRGAVGPFRLFETDGSIVPIFANSNMVLNESELFTYSPEAGIAVGHDIGYSDGDAFGPKHSGVEVLHIVPTAPRQVSALTVILGPPVFGFDDNCLGGFWSWRYDDVDADGWPEIHIGPRLDTSGNIAPQATFRWSRQEGRYVGPAGSPEQGFLVYDTTDCDEVQRIHRRFAAYWRSRQATREGHRISECTHSTIPLDAIEPIPDWRRFDAASRSLSWGNDLASSRRFAECPTSLHTDAWHTSTATVSKTTCSRGYP
ncbi:MAG: hypothetical protein ABIT71_02695 [Vicinamibacteraceae bacterium]